MSRPSSRGSGGRPGSATRPSTDPGGDGTFLPPLAKGPDATALGASAPLPPRAGSGGSGRPRSAGRRTTVLRECNWLIDSDVPSSPDADRGAGNVGAYLRHGGH